VAWIEVMLEEKAQGELAEVYRRIAGSRGKVANIMRVQSLNPDSMRVHLDLYLAVTFGPSGLSRNERELIAVVVSEVNGCAYCVAHHGEALCHYWQDRERVEQAARDFLGLELPERTRRILAYAKKLTCAPHEMKEGDVRRLREVGLSDREILDVNLIVSYFNFVNRIALGLGVELSPDDISGYRY